MANIPTVPDQNGPIEVNSSQSGSYSPAGGGINTYDSTPHASGNAANQAGSSFYALPCATTYEQQLSKMEKRGLVVEDEAFALRKLEDLNYYRLRGYWLTLERDDRFIAGASFNDIWEIYQLDRDLRGWLWLAIAPIEIKLRTQFAYQLSRHCGPDAYLDAGCFSSQRSHDRAMESYARERDRAYSQNVPCVVHNMNKYGKLPVWAAVEIMSFGTLSMLYGNLDPNAGKTNGSIGVADAIAKAFGTKQPYLKNWTHHLVTVRNIAAHHDRFYNRMMNIRVRMLKRDAKFVSDKQYPTFLVIKRIYERSWPEEWIELSSELSTCFGRHPGVDLGPMGFPDDWRSPLCL